MALAGNSVWVSTIDLTEVMEYENHFHSGSSIVEKEYYWELTPIEGILAASDDQVFQMSERVLLLLSSPLIPAGITCL